MDAGLVGERAFADQTLVPGQRAVGGGGDPLRQRREARQIHLHLEAVQLAQTEHHLFQGGVASPLAQTIDRGVGVGGAAQRGGQGVGGGQSQIVVSVHFQFEIDRRPQTLENRQHAERFHDAQRVGEAESPAPLAWAVSAASSRKS